MSTITIRLPEPLTRRLRKSDVCTNLPISQSTNLPSLDDKHHTQSGAFLTGANRHSVAK